MAINSVAKRRSLVGLGNPLMPITYASFDGTVSNTDRSSVAWNYAGFTWPVGIAWTAIGSAFKSDQTERAGGRFRELFAADDLTI